MHFILLTCFLITFAINVRELKQQRQRRLWKRHLKNEFTLLQTLLHLFQLIQFIKCWQIFLELNSKRLYQSSGKEKESHRLVFTFSTKREFRHFHIVIMQQGQINVQKSMMHEQSCCFANLKTLFFSRSCCRCHCHRLSSLLFYWILSFADICIVELFGRKLHFFIHGAVTFHFWKSSMEYSFYFMDICILKLGVYISFTRNHF